MPVDCNEDAGAKACAFAKDWPLKPQTTSGTDDPENNVIGYWPGDLYMRTSTSKLYAFNGTGGTAVGWNILN